MSDEIRVGVVGLGGICRQRHLPGLAKIEGVRVTAVVNRSRESSERAAKEFGIANVCDTPEQLIARDDLDAVFIGTWPYLHRDLSVAALESGKHVFCQARMAMDAAEAREMYAAWKTSGRVAMICPAPFGLSVDKTIARLIREGYLGQVRLLRVSSFTNAYASADALMNWRKDHRLSGLNMHMLGMYIEAAHRWFGWTKRVSAMTNIFAPERSDESGARVRVEIPDQILFNAEMENGVPAQFVFNAAVAQTNTDAFEILGSEGSLRYEVYPDKLYGGRGGEPFAPVEVRGEDAYDVKNWRVERDFIDAIRLGADYHPNFHDGLKYMETIQAVYDSARTGRVVEIG